MLASEAMFTVAVPFCSDWAYPVMGAVGLEGTIESMLTVLAMLIPMAKMTKTASRLFEISIFLLYKAIAFLKFSGNI
jgi:hypothetical protein